MTGTNETTRPALPEGWGWDWFSRAGVVRTRAVVTTRGWRESVAVSGDAVEVKSMSDVATVYTDVPIAVVLACVADAHPLVRGHMEAAIAAIGGRDE